ncbi:DUF4058 family protein [Zavarzinella formosa]|uniref:DUF4058 family protein n=1 Tax=Zavarzinella formosa TaxID=360055 RepID=UPI0002F7A835|nr:DUF4058 family protein [Zavarzinella formosa]
MPLRDHFHATSTLLNWEALHGGWPAMIVRRLNSILPEEYVAQPRLHFGTMAGHRSGKFEEARSDRPILVDGDKSVAVVPWTPSAPTILLDTEFPEPSEYEVNIYTQDEFRLVAAIELVSPSNKDRPENRQTFVNKCESLLKKDVCVTIVDPVTNRTANLYGELLDELHAPRTEVSRSGIYAVTCRGRRLGPRWRLESWEHELAVGGALPTLPVWLSPDLMVPLELELTCEEACRSLRIR